MATKKKKKSNWWADLIKKYTNKGYSFKDAIKQAKKDPIYLKKKGKTKTVKSTKKPKSKRTKLARKKRSRKRRSFTLPMSIVVPLAWKVYESVKAGVNNGNWEQSRKDALWHWAFIDWNGKPNLMALKSWVPVLLGLGVHYAAKKAGVNRALGRAGVPLIRV